MLIPRQYNRYPPTYPPIWLCLFVSHTCCINTRPQKSAPGQTRARLSPNLLASC